MERRTVEFPVAHWLAACAALALAYAALNTAGLRLPEFGSRITMASVALGLSLGALLRGGVRYWPGVAIGSVVSLTTLGASGVQVALSTASALAATLLPALLLNATGFDRRFESAADVAKFSAATVAGAALAGTLGTAALTFGQTRPVLLETWFRWSFGALSGIALVTPLVLTAGGHAVRAAQARAREFAGWAALLAIASTASLLIDPAYGGAPVLIVAVVLVTWAVSRFTLFWGMVAVFGVAGSIFASVAASLGVAAGAPARLALRGAWNTALLLSVQALLLHAVLAGRARAEQRWRRLFEGNLQPLWVADAEGRVVLVNDAAVRQYGHSRESFAALTVGDLVAAPPDGAPRVGTWHRRADGTLLEIEMTTQPLPGDETLTYATDVTERNALRRALADASSTERRRLAHDVHDGLGQELTALSMFARSLVTRVRREAPAGALALEEIAETIERTARGALESCRRIARGLSPIDSAGGRLHDALEALARGASLPDGTAVTYTGDLANADLPPEDADHLYRIAQEALANAQRHAGAIEIRLVAARNGDELRLAIEDDGAGLSAAARSRPGLGLRTMRSRAAQIGAAFAIEPRDGGGTRVLVRYPLEARG